MHGACLSLLNQPIFKVKSEDRVHCGKKLHQLAVIEPSKEKDLRVKDVILGRFGIRMCACMLC